ncbi:dicarboxylate/amino acid:cation symporter [Pleionea sp. CnH1-48]|uniref:dicarboxylate/amino acid:cation symporter n=1 Tax=Pleionea sp. CnH1-48 TaxID=2954494 RepID=UPI0020976B39|nr:dicarboxylate/amino acid:cation symporter [Pleionea sp. CnH1-48]MCO7223924.1 dicarboxylate/amino acid:cation symporter [Pleionea sp. CnH1-48]
MGDNQSSMKRNLEIISIMIRKALWAQIILAMILGLSVGLLLSPEGGALVSKDMSLAIASWLKLPGSIFLNLIQMVVIPLIISSIILGICSSGDPDYLKRVGLRIFPYFLGTTTIAVSIGVVLALLIEPGAYIDSNLLSSSGAQASAIGIKALETTSAPEQIAALIPTNITEANIKRNMLQIVIFSIIVGVAVMSLSKEKMQPFLSFGESIQEIALKIVSWAMLLAPYAVFGLLADITIRVGFEAIVGVSVYVGTVLLGLISLLAFYLLIVKFVAKKNILSFIKSVREVQLLAFSTSSSAAVMPLSMKTATQKLNVKPAISKFIVPLGATVNMDGTALYQVVAALFLTQVYGIDLSAIEVIILVLTTVGASIGSPSTPGVGIVILATILQGLGIPPSGIALIIGVDRILDMCRTTVNVTGDLTACSVMNKLLEEPTTKQTAKA